LDTINKLLTLRENCFEVMERVAFFDRYRILGRSEHILRVIIAHNMF